jgi:hypothetical protein
VSRAGWSYLLGVFDMLGEFLYRGWLGYRRFTFDRT